MSAALKEYLLKGVFLGVWAYLALIPPDNPTLLRVAGWGAGGFALGLLAGAGLLVRRGYRPTANPGGFALLTLLDSPFVIYLGLVGGVTLGIAIETEPPAGREWLAGFAVGGAVLGYGLHQLTQVRDKVWRFALGGLVGAGLVYLAIHYVGQLPDFAEAAAQQRFAAVLLAGLPFFYVLTFCGEADESEVEIAALCAVLAVGLYLLRLSSNLPEYGDKLILIVPVVVYFVYATRWLPRLRVFKHVLRGYGSLSVGRVREALVGFSRALQLNPRSEAAAQGLWRLHRQVDVSALDADTLKLLNFDFCLDLASGLLIKDRPPTDAERADAVRLLDLVDANKPAAGPRVDYLRAVGFAHAKEYDRAADVLGRLLDPETPYPEPATRDVVLFEAWDLALRVHPELVKRLGPAELAKPGRRVSAITAVERRLAKQPDDPAAVGLKRELYAGLTEAEFAAAAATAPPAGFNYEYVEQLGLALIGEADPAQVERGMAYLRIAARGLQERGPGLFKTLADLAAKLGRADESDGYLGQAKRTGLAVGPKALPADQREAFLAAVKALTETAAARGDFAAAAENQRLFVEAGKEDPNTLRPLAEYYAKAGDLLNAVLTVETGLLYAKADPDLLAKKDSYYYSLGVDQLAAVKEKVERWFDVGYCVRKATAVANAKEADVETLDYGLHLARLARVIAPTSQSVRLVEARLLLRKGERDAALTLLEDVRQEPKGSGEEEDAWYVATRLLGDLYLDELNRPDLAVGCFSDYRSYQKSGADTLYRLGQAQEAAGNVPAAVKAFEAVTAYTSHPRYWEATEAVRRLKGQ
jgi:tetratricopeptide (TPR) repeat protein